MKNLVRELTKLPYETEWVEFKVNNIEPQMIGEYISALSNSATLFGRTKGYLVWGIEDKKHEIVGTYFDYRNAKKGNEELESWLTRMLAPRLNIKFHEIFYDELKVVVLEIPNAEREPTKFSSEEYIKIGSNKKNLKGYPEKERRLWQLFDNTPFELHYAKENIKKEKIFEFLNYVGYYNLLNQPIPKNEEKIIEDFGITYIKDKYFATLSQGEQRRTLLARAFMNEPDLLILDEPCSGLDVKSREYLLSVLEKNSKNENAIPFIYVTHQIEEVIPAITHVTLLKDGKVFAKGRKKDILTDEVLSEMFEMPVKVVWENDRPWLIVK